MKPMFRTTLLSLMFLLPASAVAQQRWWGHFADGMTTTSMGTATAETYTCGASFSTSSAMLSGATLHGVRFCLRDKTNVSDVKVWLSSTLPATADAADILVVNVAQEALTSHDADGSMVEVALPTPYAFAGSVYVGYAFKVGSAKTEADKHPIVCSGKGNGAQGSFWIRSSKTLISWSNPVTNFGALAMQLLVSNPSLPLDAAQLQGLDRMVSLTGTPTEAVVELTSKGFAELRSIDCVIDIDGSATAERHYDLSTPLWGAGNSTQLSVTFDTPAASGVYDCAIRLTKVNGQPVSDASSLTSSLVAADRMGHRRSVVEEYTGTWCTNCPRGIVGMHNLSEAFGDDFIGIAVHTNSGATRDPMYLAAYAPLIPSGVPRCQMDRKLWCDPYMGTATDRHFHADDAFRQMLAQPTEADLKLEAAWADEAHTRLQLSATTTFHIDSPQVGYALAFVVTEDGMTGTTKEWWQVNGDSRSNTYPDADMDRFRNAPDPVTDIAYDHVPVAAVGIVGGIDGSIAAPIASGLPQTYTTTIDLAANTVVQDKARLEACAMLLDKATGQMVNAARCAISASAAVNEVAMPTTRDNTWHMLDGRRIDRPSRRGLYLNGSRKTLVR